MSRPSVNQRMSQVLGLAQQTISGMQPNETVEPGTAEVAVVAPTAVVRQQSPEIVSSEHHEQDIPTDYDYARKTLYHSIELGNEALEHLLPLAKESESPRGFEVTHMLLKTVSEMAKDLLELHQRMDALHSLKSKSSDAGGNTTNIQNNTVMVTTADMVRMARKAINAIDISPEN